MDSNSDSTASPSKGSYSSSWALAHGSTYKEAAPLALVSLNHSTLSAINPSENEKYTVLIFGISYVVSWSIDVQFGLNGALANL